MLTPEQIEIARQAGFIIKHTGPHPHIECRKIHYEELEQFAAAIRLAAIDECIALVCQQPKRNCSLEALAELAVNMRALKEEKNDE